MFAADTVDDLKNLPNLERAGEETNIRWFAKVGSCVRVIGAGRWYVLSPSNVWCPLFYMSTEVEDAVEHNVETIAEAKKRIGTDVNGIILTQELFDEKFANA